MIHLEYYCVIVFYNVINHSIISLIIIFFMCFIFFCFLFFFTAVDERCCQRFDLEELISRLEHVTLRLEKICLPFQVLMYEMS